MSWFALAPALLTAILLLLVPGLPIAYAAGARGISLLGLGVGASVAAIAVSSIAASLLGLPWQPYTPLLVTVPVTLTVLFLRRWWLRSLPAVVDTAAWGTTFYAALGALSVGAILIAIPLKVGIGVPDWPSQTYDASFHLNAVQHVLQTLDASPFTMTVSTPESSGGFYPTVWHAIVAVIVQVTALSIPAASTAATFAVACLVWPLSCIFLARQLFGPRSYPLVLTGVFSAAFAAFPLLLVEWGVLYPVLLAFSLLPLVLGTLVIALGVGTRPLLEPWGRWLLFFWLLGGMGLAHPSAVFGLLVVALPLSVHGLSIWVGAARNRVVRRRRTILGGGLLVLSCGLGVAAWTLSATSDNAWQPYETVAQAVGEALFNGPLRYEPAIAVSLLALAGIIVSFRSRRFVWLSLSYALLVFLYVVAAAWPEGSLRTGITGLWYNDWTRLAAMLPLLTIPLAVLGASVLIDALTACITRALDSRSRRGRTTWVTGTVTVILVALLIPLTQTISIADARDRITVNYQLFDQAQLVTPNEMAMFDLVDAIAPADAVIAGNPWNGSGLVYAYTGREALFSHLGGAYGDDRWAIAEDLATDVDAVCPEIVDLNVQYVLDFGTAYIFGDDPRSRLYPGFRDLAASDAVTLVATEGSASLYAVTACGLNPPGLASASQKE
ncbi:hypothetical protein E3T55_08340 [Cryobacterium frigoriphilum]|uniref:Uncharacterized protein n=1 Tax=Cryobacterium frigoriphilum TaxID=1259150 RepID=A0A4R9A2B1_9MICO|nr:DUF6541 family protein [Cryobacterium frigoriphilum]TFD50797.1 hypothetical protein E3T55_08340 [Cryobacterium frigoriphilum]